MRKYAAYLHPHLLAVLAMGFSSGLPSALVFGTLAIWLKEEGISKSAIGLLSGVTLIYSFKLAWSPLMDNVRIPVLTRLFGQRRSWFFVSQAALALSIILLGMTSPAESTLMVGLCALLVAFCSATQDIVVDAYRIERLTPEQQPMGAAMGVLGWRIGALASGAGALYLATYYGWAATYFMMALLLPIGALAVLVAGEPPRTVTQEKREGNPLQWYVAPLKDFMQRPNWVLLIVFVFSYKLADAFLGIMANPFYLEVGFEKTQIADISKVYGLIATVGGGFLGAWMVKKWGLFAPLWIGGVACAVTNLLFIPLIAAGPDMLLLAGIITFDNASVGVSSTALVAFMSALCKREYTASQYAMLTSLFTAARSLSSTPAGWVAEILGWEAFFILSAALAVPGLVALRLLQRRSINMPPQQAVG